MNGQNEPLRRCVGCRVSDIKAHLRRFVLVNGTLMEDPRGHADGRGAWCHPECLADALKRGGFARSFRTKVKIPS